METLFIIVYLIAGIEFSILLRQTMLKDDAQPFLIFAALAIIWPLPMLAFLVWSLVDLKV